MSEPAFTEDQRDALQEIANLAMGRAATRLARLLDSFIELSVPRVRMVAVGEAACALREMTGIDETLSAVRQGFRSDIKGEALVICRSDGIAQLCALVNDPYARSSYETIGEHELMLDVANLLCGACVSSILEQLGRTPVFSAPGLLGEALTFDEVFQPGMLQWHRALLLEVNFALENHSFRAHLVMLMAEESIRHMNDALDALLSSL
ncbi:chemotaxis protein CheC [Paraburkholderia antibiotica]|uniref:Chemotaxis protein n=1 Tax=Paraburkholderia antibiotica TaxID=2728839 RepID=A0A7X9X567_9BURK|nr:chemotaxis protein CheC [Paraburkholderia antibiotica]NML31414.1 chemotaxis protein [Paraburkholderia antibiotica]